MEDVEPVDAPYELTKSGYEFVGIDLSESLLKRAKE